MVRNLILAAVAGMLLATLAPERGAAITLPQISAETSSLIVKVRPRCNRLWRRCNRGNLEACRLYRFECVGARPIY